MIRLLNVNKYFNKRKSNEIRAIDNTTVELADKGLVTFLGNSGCGKTTLLNAIGGLDKVDSGDIFIDDKKITHISSSKKDEIRNVNVGYIFQNYNLIDDDTVFDNVALVLSMMGLKDKKVIEERVMYILQKVGIDKYRNRPTKMLSGGERQRVGIARALVKNPKIIIADEPTGNLDSKNTLEIMNIIKAISREKLVILVTHEREIAEFYSSRIIEIIDGRIVKDRTNDHDDDLDYRLENKIYLKDMAVQESFGSEKIKVDYYSDKKDQPLQVKIVVKNNNIYVETDGNLQPGLDTMEMVDDHYKKISKDIYEEYEFDYEKMIDKDFVPKYSSIFNPRKLLVEGYKKVFGYSIIKKILLVGFLFASMFVIYSVSNTAGILTVNDDEFVTVNKNYLTVSTSKLDVETFQQYENMEGIDYALPGSSLVNFSFPIDDYYQTVGAETVMNGSLSSKDMLTESDLIAGKLPTTPQEIVIDRMVVDVMLDAEMTKQIGIKANGDFVGRTAKVNSLKDFTIVGVVDMGSPSIYTDKSMFMDILMNQSSQSSQGGAEPYAADGETGGEEGTGSTQITNWDLVKDNGELSIVRGTAPDEDYEVLAPESMRYEKAIGSTIDTKVNGQKLKICGFYSDKRNGTGYYVSANTARINYIVGQKNITLSPTDKAATFGQLSGGEIKVTDNYESDRETYFTSINQQILATIALSLVILVISLVEMYLMLRSSFLSRIKEVGVLRAIGLKKKDIYKMFIGEIFALTTLTAIPAMGVMAYIIHGISQLPYVGNQYLMNPGIFLVSLAIVFVFNMVAGLLPVFTTMRKTPAAILARNDVN